MKKPKNKKGLFRGARKSKKRKLNPVKMREQFLKDPRFLQAVEAGVSKGILADEENAALFSDRRDKLAFAYTLAGKQVKNLPTETCDLIFQAFCAGYTQRYVDTLKLEKPEGEATERANTGDGNAEPRDRIPVDVASS